MAGRVKTDSERETLPALSFCVITKPNGILLSQYNKIPKANKRSKTEKYFIT